MIGQLVRAVLFDLDGTLLDTHAMILASFRHAWSEVVGPHTLPPENELMAMVGIPLVNQMQTLAPECANELVEAYRDNNARIHDTMLRGFEGMAKMLATLQEQGYRLAVVTSKKNAQALHGLSLQGLDGYFEFLVGSDDTTEHKPKPAPLLLAAKRLELEPAQCAYVGDSPFDMQAARAAGMYAIGVLWGMFSAPILVDAGAEVLVKTVPELPDCLNHD